MAVELTSAIVDSLDNLSVFETDADGRTGVSASFAIVSYPEDGSSREELLAAAEISLEQSKEERKAMRMPKRQLSAVQQLRLSGRRRSA
jgi:GGDEF domain-containing protein